MATKTRTRKPPRPLEREVQKNALKWLKSAGIPAWRRNVISVPLPATGRHKRRFVRSAEPGQSDIWGIVYDPIHGTGRHFEAEVKRPDERPTLAQILWLREINEMTGAAFWFSDIATLAKVMGCLMAGGKVEYLAGQRNYSGVAGPTDEFDIIWPD